MKLKFGLWLFRRKSLRYTKNGIQEAAWWKPTGASHVRSVPACEETDLHTSRWEVSRYSSFTKETWKGLCDIQTVTIKQRFPCLVSLQTATSLWKTFVCCVIDEKWEDPPVCALLTSGVYLLSCFSSCALIHAAEQPITVISDIAYCKNYRAAKRSQTVQRWPTATERSRCPTLKWLICRGTMC